MRVETSRASTNLRLAGPEPSTRRSGTFDSRVGNLRLAGPERTTRRSRTYDSPVPNVRLAGPERTTRECRAIPYGMVDVVAGKRDWLDEGIRVLGQQDVDGIPHHQMY